MPVKIGGLPAHVLLIHVVVVLLPLAAIMLVAGALWPTARRKLGVLTPALAFVGLVFVPITTHAGKWLRDRLPATKAIDKHAELGDTLLPWALGIFLVAAGIWALGRRYEMAWRRPAPIAATEASEERIGAGGGTATATATATRPVTGLRVLPMWVTGLAAALAIAVSVGGMVQLYRIGDSGARAVWGGVVDQPAQGASIGR